MKITCVLIILVVGVAAIHGAKLKSREKEVENGDDKLQHLRARLEELMSKKRDVAPLMKSENEKRGTDKRKIGYHGFPGCHVHDFIYLFTSLPEIRDALFELGNPQQVIDIVEEMALVYGKLQGIVNPAIFSPPPPLR